MEARGVLTPVYSHRQNPNQTFDSICHCCFSTVATELNEADLARHEQLHQCDAVAQARTLTHKDNGMSSQPRFSAASDAA